MRANYLVSLLGLAGLVMIASPSVLAETDDGMPKVREYSGDEVMGFLRRLDLFNNSQKGRPDLPCDTCDPWMHHPEYPAAPLQQTAPSPLQLYPPHVDKRIQPEPIDLVAPRNHTPAYVPSGSEYLGDPPPQVNRAPLPPGCKEGYDKVYNKPEVDMRVVFGYMDMAPGVPPRDPALAHRLMDRALSSCTNANRDGLCGFREAKEDPFLLEKEIYDHNNQLKTVKLRVVYSAATEKADVSMDNWDQDQRESSKYACDIFDEGLSQDGGILLYGGHNRGIYGPDCDPPVRAKDGWYNLADPKYHPKPPKQTRIQQVRSKLASSSTKPAILGIIACNAGKKEQAEALRKVAPETGIILPKSEIWFESIANTIEQTLDSALSFRCGDEFNQTLANVRRPDDGVTQIEGLLGSKASGTNKKPAKKPKT